MATARERPVDDDRRVQALATDVARTMLDQAVNSGSVYVDDRVSPVVQQGDVAHDVERFGTQVVYAWRAGLPLPCLTAPGMEPLPINVDGVLFPLGVEADPSTAAEVLNRLAGPSPSGFVELMPPEDARGAFEGRLVRFLVRRLGTAGGRDRPPTGPDREPTPGLRFEVTTDTPGLRVYYHPSYWHDSTAVFGQPSTPVRGYIRPGRYMFGAMGHGRPLVFEPAEYEIPHQTSAHLFL